MTYNKHINCGIRFCFFVKGFSLKSGPKGLSNAFNPSSVTSECRTLFYCYHEMLMQLFMLSCCAHAGRFYLFGVVIPSYNIVTVTILPPII